MYDIIIIITTTTTTIIGGVQELKNGRGGVMESR